MTQPKVTSYHTVQEQLEPFFLDNTVVMRPSRYTEIFEFSNRVTPKRILSQLAQDGLLIEDRVNPSHITYQVNKESDVFRKENTFYWHNQLKEHGVLSRLRECIPNSSYVLVGDVVQSTLGLDGLLQIAVLGSFAGIDFSETSKKLGKEISVFPLKTYELYKHPYAYLLY